MIALGSPEPTLAPLVRSSGWKRAARIAVDVLMVTALFWAVPLALGALAALGRLLLGTFR